MHQKHLIWNERGSWLISVGDVLELEAVPGVPHCLWVLRDVPRPNRAGIIVKLKLWPVTRNSETDRVYLRDVRHVLAVSRSVGSDLEWLPTKGPDINELA